jgi:hypothetical protein
MKIVFSPKSIFVRISVYRSYNTLYNILNVFEHFVVEFVYSEKSRLLIIYDGYKFRFHKTLKDDVQRWPCCFKNCKCFIKLSPPNIIVEINTNHEHRKHDEKVLNRQIMSNSLKRKALVDISCKPSKLIRSELKYGDIPTLTNNDLSLI